MTNDLPLPSDLQHLIEKRSGEERRGPSVEPDAADGSEAAIAPAENDEAGTDGSPGDAERRKKSRRHEDQ